MKLPIKTRILQYAIQRGSEFTAADAYTDLQNEYAGERFFSPKTVAEYVEALLGVGFLSASRTEFDSKGQLQIFCKATEYGKSRKKYMQ